MICFSAEAQNYNIERMSREILHSFFDQLECVGLLQNRMMVLRVEIVATALVKLALERNELAQTDPQLKGVGTTVEIVMQTVNHDGVQLTITDTGGKTACISKKHVDEYVDLVSFELTNGGLTMRAFFKWASCQ